MSALHFILRSLWHYRRAHLGLLAGTVLAAAILTGALVVGDSVGYTLQTYAMQRLGRVQLAVTSGEKTFSTALLTPLKAALNAPQPLTADDDAPRRRVVSCALALPGMAIYQDESGKKMQVNRVQALGVDRNFWTFARDMRGAMANLSGDTRLAMREVSLYTRLERRECALDIRLAEQLGVKPGDTVALRISKPGLLSRDAPLSSREEDTSARANFKVKFIAGDDLMGRFSLAAGQLPPYNFFTSREDLQQLAEVEDQANLLLAGAGTDVEGLESALRSVWKPEFSGLKAVQRGNVLQLESKGIFLDAATEKAALALPGAQGALTYLVNGLESGGRATPYSFMTAGGPLTEGLRDDEIVINAWLAEQLGVAEGGQVSVKYYEVLPSNKFIERTRAFTVKRVGTMEEFAAEKALVPEFPGLSNVESCKDWKIGMPMDEQLLKDTANEDYWKQYHETPKALVTLAAGQSMWANRFGRLTGVRFATGLASASMWFVNVGNLGMLKEQLPMSDYLLAAIGHRLSPRDAGMEVRDVGAEAERAAKKSGELGGLFLGMSFFLLGAALVLTGLLYAFGAQQRAEEAGVLAALGYTRARIRALLLGEALLVALPGAVIGAELGMVYAWALLIGLANYWQDAVGRIPILFYPNAPSLVYGIVGTIVCALIAAWVTVRRLLKHSVNDLLRADFTQPFSAKPTGRAWFFAEYICWLSTAGMVGYALYAPPADPAETFFTSGFLALAGGLIFAWRRLSPEKASTAGAPTIASLARMNAARRRGRSLAMVASLASGGFLVLATSAMQSDVHANADKRWAGTGGFAFYGESTVPILDPQELAKAMPGITPYGLRVYDGDDASCLNLNQAIRPRVIGVDDAVFTELKAFVEGGDETLWSLLDRNLGDKAIPALVGDSDTAMWTLKKTTGVEKGDLIPYRDDAGREVNLKLVGKLPMRMSVFQGTVLISAKNFTELWPSREGFRAFLIDAPADGGGEVIEKLRNKFDRSGLDIVPATTRLAMFHAVEGTYLSMFLVLGGIGLLLGATATGVVVLRNLLERRREIALLRALGFTPRDVFRLIFAEYGRLLVLAAAIGAVASGVVMIPALHDAHGVGSIAARLAAFALVIGSAALCALAGLRIGLRNTATNSLNAE